MTTYIKPRIFCEACDKCHRMLILSEENIYKYRATDQGVYFLCGKCNSSNHNTLKKDAENKEPEKYYLVLKDYVVGAQKWVYEFDTVEQLETFLNTECGKDSNDLLVFRGSHPDIFHETKKRIVV